jgi:NSS family neurotransmitter:Na+ symporter
LVFGIQKGIERLSKVLMPLFFLLLLILIARVLSLPGAIDGVTLYLQPDWSKVDMATVLDALGLSFFSLSLGVGVMITYGAYIQEKTQLFHSSLWVILLTSVTCFLSGLMILPAMFVFGIEHTAGPGLTFITMPGIFYQFPGGQYFSVIFFTLLVVAALTSAVSIYEVVLRFMIEQWKMPRIFAALLYAVAIFIVGSACSLSLGIWSHYTAFGMNLFDLLSFVSEKIMMPMTEIGLALMVGWFIWPKIYSELIQGMSSNWGVVLLKPLNQWVAPGLIAWIMLDYLFKMMI